LLPPLFICQREPSDRHNVKRRQSIIDCFPFHKRIETNTLKDSSGYHLLLEVPHALVITPGLGHDFLTVLGILDDHITVHFFF